MTGLAAFLVIAALALGGNTLARYQGWTVERLPPAVLSAKLAPFYRVLKPSVPRTTSTAGPGC